MNQFLLITKNILRQIFRKKSNFLIYLILPIVGMLVPLAMFSNTDNTFINVGIVNRDNGVISDKLLEDIKLQERFKISEMDESQVNQAITNGTLDCALIVPADFSTSFLSGDSKKIDMVSVQGISATGWVENYLRVYLSNLEIMSIGSNRNNETFINIYTEYRREPSVVKLESVKNIATGYNITYLGLGFLIQFLLVGAGRTASLIIKEREEKTLSRIKCAPVKGIQFISSNVIINVSLVLLQTLIALTCLRYVFNIDIGVSLINLIIVMFPLLIAAVGMALMLVSFAKNDRHLSTLMTIFIYPTCLLSGCFWDVDMMPQFMQKIALFMPQRWALDGIESLMMGNPLSDVLINLLVLTAFGAAFFAIAVFGFSRKQTANA